MTDPTAPTEIKAHAVNQTVQTVWIDPDGRTRDARVALVIALDPLVKLREQLAGDLKAVACDKAVKHVDGDDGAAGELRLQKIPRVPVVAQVLNAIAQRAAAERKPLQLVLLDLADAGVITINKTKLEEQWGKVPVDALCEDGIPNAPSMVFDAPNTPTPAAALATLLSLSKKNPKRFDLVDKPRAKKSDPPKPRVRYVEGTPPATLQGL